jgi:predicted metal-binding membrane protein
MPASTVKAEVSAMERLLRRDRALVAAALLAVIALAWLYLLQGAGMAMTQAGLSWSFGRAAINFAMWAVMMLAMMLPSAAPMILLYATIRYRRGGPGGKAATTAFLLSYVVVWVGFSLAATLLQWSLDQALLLSPMMRTTSVATAGALLIAAGVYQWTPLKQACLRHCRSPLDFILTSWREGLGGAFGMGLRHGAYCVGCCWALMALLFVGGVMNLVWIAGIAAFVLAEKVAPGGVWFGRLAGLALIAWGGATLWTLA